MPKVRDGARFLEFDGSLLADSSSWRREVPRWVEFRLYRTSAGRYVLSRIGLSLVYHTEVCALVSRNRLSPQPFATLDPKSVPCETCKPNRDGDAYPETSRFWAQVADTASGVIESLYRYDERGNRYLTLVAQRLLDTASELDEDLSESYRTERIA